MNHRPDPDSEPTCLPGQLDLLDELEAPETIHELEAHRVWPQTLEEPGESWCRCTCGEEMDSIGSAGGPALTVAELFHTHLKESP